ncbi:hypothetical protein ABFB50_04255 [Dehalococcoides sp. THU3]|uniref:hypothetical protein n=1 Tax=Dehalococcoides TaxID=61434 RepID=UPI0005B56E65|nr:hypothetical protein [Dehalococcoides sp. UCH007]BAQ34221.1 hypothetical protein UCH007_02630 [Dehalococcoides sp. UCH007]
MENLNTNRIGEVIDTSTTDFTAQSYQLYNTPALGALVKTGEGENTIYAAVYHATTSSIEPGRKPIARGQDAANEEDIYAQSPQLSKLLRSEFSCLILGYRGQGQICHCLPPRPAHIHSFAETCTPQETAEFSRSFGFLNILVNSELPVPADEVTAACLRQLAAAAPDKQAFLVKAGKELARILPGQYQRLKVILERIQL